jgi:hypothetical protein
MALTFSTRAGPIGIEARGVYAQKVIGTSFMRLERVRELFLFPQFFINPFFKIGKHFIDMLYISLALEHEEKGFHLFPNNHAKKESTAQDDYRFHYSTLVWVFLSKYIVIIAHNYPQL